MFYYICDSKIFFDVPYSTKHSDTSDLFVMNQKHILITKPTRCTDFSNLFLE